MEPRQRGSGVNVMRTVLGVLNHSRHTKGSYRLQSNVGGLTPAQPRASKHSAACENMSPVIEGAKL
jgi:hypothetical protein